MSDGSYCHCHCVIGICVSAAKFDSNRQSNYFLLLRRDVKLWKYGDQRPLTPSSIGLISAPSFPSGGECGVQSAECSNQALIPSICWRTLHLLGLRPSSYILPLPCMNINIQIIWRIICVHYICNVEIEELYLCDWRLETCGLGGLITVARVAHWAHQSD